MDPFILLFQLVVLLFSVVIHEVSHGATALVLGDTTARDQGRLTLNPLKHLDPFGSVILPLTLLALSAAGGPGVIFGWARPVPYNPHFFKRPRLGSALVGVAGPLSNIVLALVFAFGFHLLVSNGLFGIAGQSVSAFFASIVIINLFLAIFNLVPIPPLDGSKLLLALLSDRYMGLKMALERYGLFLFILFIFVVSDIVSPIVQFLLNILGVS